MSSSYQKYSVFLCQVAESFKPQHLWHQPDVILSAELHSRNLSAADAKGCARAHNKSQMAGGSIESWAIVTRGLRPNRSRPMADIDFAEVDGEIGLLETCEK